MVGEVEKIMPVDRLVVESLQWPSFSRLGIQADVLRLDALHPTISGNKWFKLKEYLRQALQTNQRGILTFGGAYSNHLVATACVAQAAGLSSIGVVRGERSWTLSHTLQAAAGFGMELRFLTREQYSHKAEPAFAAELKEHFPGYYFIAEGGAGALGVQGSEDILRMLEKNTYTHILCAVGTATMMAGLANASGMDQWIEGVFVLKDMSERLDVLQGQLTDPRKIAQCRLHTGYHFGGYAKKTSELIGFMNRFYQTTGVPTDFVYTAKLCYAALDLAERHYFAKGSNLLLVHSGGLQGNLSLAQGTLNF